MPSQRWEWLGEPLGIDFANTIRRHGNAYVEYLNDPDDLREWASREPVRLPPDADVDVDHVRAVRDAVFALLRAATNHEPPPADAEHCVNAALAAVPLVRQLDAGAIELMALETADPVDELLARAAHSALDFLDDPALGFCDAPSCGQFFLRHRRDQRFCDPSCGTRSRVARHASRSR